MSAKQVLPGSIKVSREELSRKSLNSANLEEACRCILRDGLVVVEDVVDHEVLDTLNEKMVADAKILRDEGENSPFNYHRGNLQQDAPPLQKYFDKTIFLNPIASQITAAVLGPRPKLTFCSGNTAMPPSADVPPQRQPVHSDADFDHPSRPFALVVNVPLVAMNPHNGSTEVWLGTHDGCGVAAQEGAHGERASGRIQQEFLDQRRTVAPPVQPVIPKGSIVVRDLRLWHAGMPNYSDEIRVMLAMIHFAPWYNNQMRLEWADSLRSTVEEEKDLDVRADFVPDVELEGRYLFRGFGNSYDFSEKAVA